MSPTLPIKKSVSFQWQGLRLDLDVAQDVFSSHQVDKGSRMLLDSLDPSTFAESGRAADFGSGYGVLGLAWQVRFPKWKMHYIDRDALAVAFSGHNVMQLSDDLAERAAFTCDISLPLDDPAGYDLVLWNVPGKAGRDVIAGLTETVIDGIAPGGLLAVVVVHPLADIFTEKLDRADVATTHTERGKEHTVVHFRRKRGEVVGHRPFDDGLFDRPKASFSVGALEWNLTPVVGLPEYDSLNHATELAANAMITYNKEHQVQRWLVFDPGVGHLAVAAARLWPDAAGEVYGRDALALRATRRALADHRNVQSEPAWGIEQVTSARADLGVVALREQSSQEDLSMVHLAVHNQLNTGGAAIFHGRSTEVARLERSLRRSGSWRVGKPEKSRGSAAIIAMRPI